MKADTDYLYSDTDYLERMGAVTTPKLIFLEGVFNDYCQFKELAEDLLIDSEDNETKELLVELIKKLEIRTN